MLISMLSLLVHPELESELLHTKITTWLSGGCSYYCRRAGSISSENSTVGDLNFQESAEDNSVPRKEPLSIESTGQKNDTMCAD